MVKNLLDAEENADKSPAAISYEQLDQGIYLVSISSFYRVLSAAGNVARPGWTLVAPDKGGRGALDNGEGRKRANRHAQPVQLHALRATVSPLTRVVRAKSRL